MTDLRKAAEMALEALEELRFANAPFLDEAMEALRQALAESANSTTEFVESKAVIQPEQECIYPECETNVGCDGPCGSAVEQEPVTYRYKDEHGFWQLAPVPPIGAEPLYTAPPKHEWVGLTDAESKPLIQKVMMYYGHNPDHWTLTAGAGFCILARAIESKLKEKNK